MMRKFVLASASSMVFACPPATAQAPSHMDFAKHAEVSEVSLSPDGKYIAMAALAADGMESRLQIVTLDGSGKTQAMRFGRQQHVTDVQWSDDNQIVISRATMDPLKARPQSMGELFSTDTNGKNQNTLFAYVLDDGVRAGRRKDEGFATVVKVLENEPGKVLVDFTGWPDSSSDEKMTTTIYKVDTRTGNRQQLEQTRETATFMFDHAGRARFKVTQGADDAPKLMYRPSADNSWQSVPASLAGYSLRLLRTEPDNNTAYALITDKGEPEQLYKLDLAAGTRTHLAGRNDVSIARVLYAGRNGMPFGVVYDEAKLSVQYLDPNSEWAGLHAGMMQQLPGQMITPLDWSKNNEKLLFYAWGATKPGAWYLLDRPAKKLMLVSESMPWLKPEQLKPTDAITFKARDGKELHGFLTGAGGTPGPMIVLPHGGPHGPYDSWSFDPDVQFLASRGYAVLQVNFRGSGGRGRTFEQSGYGEWGGKMQDDIADGVRWAIDNQVADPKRICTYGASFGGYAALMQTIRYPELYRCAAGYVGVYDLMVMKKEGDITDRASGKRYLDRALGTDEAKLREWSPAQNADKIKVPVFLAQGSIDKRVPMAQFETMVSAFRKQGIKAETMVANGEAHGFYKPENRAELYRRLEGFLGKNIGQ